MNRQKQLGRCPIDSGDQRRKENLFILSVHKVSRAPAMSPSANRARCMIVGDAWTIGASHDAAAAAQLSRGSPNADKRNLSIVMAPRGAVVEIRAPTLESTRHNRGEPAGTSSSSSLGAAQTQCLNGLAAMCPAPQSGPTNSDRYALQIAC